MREQSIDASAYVYPKAALSRSGDVSASMITERDVLSFLFQKYNVRKRRQKAAVTLALAANMVKLRLAIDGGLKVDLREMEGLGLLDLGCGSSSSELPDHRDYEPWLCRALFAVGAKVTGVDIGDNSTEAFPHHQLDVTDPARLQIFDDESFQIVHTHQLVGWGASTSPILSEKVDEHLEAADSEFQLLRRADQILRSHAMIDDIRSGISRQAARILLINGLFSIDDGVGSSSIYQKTQPFNPTLDPLADGGCLEKVL